MKIEVPFDSDEDYSKEASKIRENNQSLVSSDQCESNVESNKEGEQYKKNQRAGQWNQFQGEIGEGIAERIATEKLGFIPDPRFDHSKVGHGFDSIYLGGKNRIVIIEAKCDEREIKALRNDQMQPEWVEQNAELMRTPGNERFTINNAEIGRDILDIGAEKVKRIVITTNPATLEIKAFEGQPNHSWKEIGKWYADDLEQPYLK